MLSAADLNAEFNSILNNALSLVSPVTGAFDFDGVTITLDAAAATQVVYSPAVSWNFTSGAKTGTPATTGSVANYSAQTFTDNATAGSGTAAAYTGFALQRPTLAATNTLVTTTDAAVFYIPNNVLAGTNETITNSWALWIDAGNVRFDDDIHWLSGQTFAQRGILAHANTGIRTYTFPDSSGTMLHDGTGLLVTGGTLTGNLEILKATPQYILNETGATQSSLVFHAAGVQQWRLMEEGNVANDFLLLRASDIQVFRFSQATGNATFAATITASNLSGTNTGDVPVATQAEMETGTAVDRTVTPGRQHFNPSAAKAWVKFNSAGTVAASYNITSITDNGTGNWTVNIATDFSTANYCGVALGGASTTFANLFCCILAAAAAGTFNIGTGTAGGGSDVSAPDEVYAVFFGDQA